MAAFVLHRKHAGLPIGFKVQIVRQPALGIYSQGLQVALAWVDHNKIIHIPNRPPLAPAALYPLIECIHVDVGEQLAGQIANGQALAGLFRFAVTAHNVFNDSH